MKEIAGGVPKIPGVVPRVGGKLLKMKKVCSLLIFMTLLILGSCEQNQIESQSLDQSALKVSETESQKFFNALESDVLDDLINFFRVNSALDLLMENVYSESNPGEYVIVVFDRNYKSIIEDADKVVYFDDSGDVPQIISTMENRSLSPDIQIIEISEGIGISSKSILTIEYNVEMEYTLFTRNISTFEICHNQCMHDILDGIFNQGSWLRRARFIANAPVELAWFIVDCGIYCL